MEFEIDERRFMNAMGYELAYIIHKPQSVGPTCIETREGYEIKYISRGDK